MSHVETFRLPNELRSMIESEIHAGERIAWVEQPVPGRLARASWPIVLFGIPWTAFAIFWTASAAWGISNSRNAGFFWAFPLFGLPFILIGLGMLSSPFWIRQQASRSAYVLTDRRAIIFRAGWRGSVTVRSFEPERLNDLRRKQNTDGSGDLVFVQDLHRDSDGDSRSTDVGFLAVSDVKAVEALVRGLVQKKRNPVA